MRNELDPIRSTRRDRAQFGQDPTIDSWADSAAADAVIEDIAGGLVAPAAVVERVFDRRRGDELRRVPDLLEEESFVMLEQALMVGGLVEGLDDGSLSVISPLDLGTQGRRDARWRPHGIDFSVPAQGTWKTLELEANLSLIQAVRAARGIPMPDYFAIFNEQRSSDIGLQVFHRQNGDEFKANINQRNKRERHTNEHLMLELGKIIGIVEIFSGNSDYEAVVAAHVGHPLPPSILNTLRRVHQLRNKGSHTELLNRSEYQTVLEGVLTPDVLSALTTLKHGLSIRR